MVAGKSRMVARIMLCLMLAASIFLAQGANAVNQAGTLTLEKAVEIALKNNPTLNASRLERDIRTLDKEIAGARHYPEIGLNATYRHYSESALIHPIGDTGGFPPLDTGVLNAGLSMRLPLYAGGKLVAGEQLAGYREQEALEQLRQNEQDLIFNVVATYAKVLQLNDLFRAQAQRLNSLASQADEVDSQYRAGRTTRLESLRIKSRISQAKVDHAATFQGERDVLKLLAALLNLSEVEGKLAPLPTMKLTVPKSLKHIYKLAREQNPRVAQARAQLDSAKTNLEMARGDRRLQVDLQANLQTRRGDEWQGRDDWDIGVSVTIPVFDGGVRRAGIDQANARRLRSQQTLTNILNEVSSEAYAALGGLNTAAAQVEAALDALNEAREAMHIQTRLFSVGRSTMTDLLSAESALWSAIAAHNQAIFDGFVAQVRLLRAVGELKPGFFEGSVAMQVPAENSKQ